MGIIEFLVCSGESADLVERIGNLEAKVDQRPQEKALTW
jgi:hypothetical protein